jgi:hypothetical protein
LDTGDSTVKGNLSFVIDPGFITMGMGIESVGMTTL